MDSYLRRVQKENPVFLSIFYNTTLTNHEVVARSVTAIYRGKWSLCFFLHYFYLQEAVLGNYNQSRSREQIDQHWRVPIPLCLQVDTFMLWHVNFPLNAVLFKQRKIIHEKLKQNLRGQLYTRIWQIKLIYDNTIYWYWESGE